MGDSCVSWSFVGTLEVRLGPDTDVWPNSLEPIPYSEMPCSTLMQGNNLDPAIPCSFPKGDLTPSEWRCRKHGCGGGDRGREQNEKGKRKLWLACKIN